LCAGDVYFVQQQQRQCFYWITPLKLYGTSICIQSSTGYHRFVRLLAPFNLHIQRKLIPVPPCRLPSCTEVICVWTLRSFDTLGCRRQRLLQQHEPTTAATDVSGTFLPPVSAGVQRRRRCDLTTAAADVGGVTLPPRLTGAQGGRHVPLLCQSVNTLAICCKPKFVFCCIPITIQLQAGFETVRHIPGICLACAWFRNQRLRKNMPSICLTYAKFRGGAYDWHMTGI
jgi:hypothetical protein